MSMGSEYYDEKICFSYSATIDNINSPFVASAYAKAHNLPESIVGEGVQIARETTDPHLKFLQKEQFDRQEYQHAKLVQIDDTRCWQYRMDVQGRKDKLGWVAEANREDDSEKCFGASVTFQMRIGNRSQMTLAVLSTWDKHADRV